MLHITNSMVGLHCCVRPGPNGHNTAYAKILQFQLDKVQLASSSASHSIATGQCFYADTSLLVL